MRSKLLWSGILGKVYFLVGGGVAAEIERELILEVGDEVPEVGRRP